MMALLLALGCAAKHDPASGIPPETYDNALLDLATGFASKEGCSCIFVSGRDEDVCRSYLRVNPDVAKIKVDYDAKRVTSKALGMKKTSAVWVSQEEGCVLEP
jgi:hypothetical protein